MRVRVWGVGGVGVEGGGLTWNARWGFQVFSIEMLYHHFALLCGLHPKQEGGRGREEEEGGRKKGERVSSRKRQQRQSKVTSLCR